MTVLLEYILLTALLEYFDLLQIQVAGKWSGQCKTGQTMDSLDD